MRVAMEKNNMERVTAENVSKKIAGGAVGQPGAVKRVSRIEKDEQLIQRAMRKKSRKILEEQLVNLEL